MEASIVQNLLILGQCFEELFDSDTLTVAQFKPLKNKNNKIQ